MRILKRIMTFSLIFCLILFLTGCSKAKPEESINTIKELKFENLRSARIGIAVDGIVGPKGHLMNEIKIYEFDFRNSKHIAILKDIINHLNSDKVQGYADVKVVSKGISPAALSIEINDGSIIGIEAAVGEKEIKFPNGTTKISYFDIPNEVMINSKSIDKPYRILSPEIRELINGGYKNNFSSNDLYSYP